MGQDGRDPDGRLPVILVDDPVPVYGERIDQEFATAGEPLEEGHLRDHLDVIRARKWSFLLAFACVVAGTTAFTFLQTPVYTASSLLLIDRPAPRVSGTDAAAGDESPTVYFRTQSELLRSRQVVEPVAKAFNVAQRDEFRKERDPIDAFLKVIRVEPVRDSRLVRVSVDSPDGHFAMMATNAIVDELHGQNGLRLRAADDRTLANLKSIEASLRPRYEATARALQEFKQDNNMLSADEVQSPAAQRLRLLNEDIARAQGERIRFAAETSTIDAVLKRGGDMSGLPVMSGSRLIEELAMERARVESEAGELMKRFKPDHPQIKAIQARLAGIEARLAGERGSLVSLVRNRLAASVAHQDGLAASIAGADASVAGLARKGVRLQMLDAEAQSVSTAYKDISRRLEEFSIALAAGAGVNNVAVVDRAFTPPLPSRPRKELNLALGVLMGLLGGLGLVFGRQYFDRAVKDGAHAERLLGYPVLGRIPRVPRNAAPVCELAAIGNPRSSVAESFRSIRAAIEFGLPAGKRPALVVTSAAADDGKTFAGVNLALAFARTGRSVLLVDADLRRPRLDDIFELRCDEGLSTTLAASAGPDLTSARRTRVFGLDVLPAGPIPVNPAELLGSASMKALLDLALSRYDCVILDAPRAVAVADVAILLAHGPQAVIVVRPSTTRSDDLVEARRVIDLAAERVAGVILNMADAPGRERNGYGRGVDLGYSRRRSAADAPRARDAHRPSTSVRPTTSEEIRT